MDNARSSEPASRPPVPRPTGPTHSGQPLPARMELLLPANSTSKRTLRRQSGRLKLVVLASSIVLVICAVATGLAAVYWYNTSLQAASQSSKRVSITIAKGTAASAIGSQLQSAGLIKKALTFYWYCKLSDNTDKLKAGTYLLAPDQTVQSIVSQIVSGKVGTYDLTILPGKTLPVIKQELEAVGFNSQGIDSAFAADYSNTLALLGKPSGANLEGYIFPDTYQLTADSTAQQLLSKTFDNFYSRITNAGLPKQLADRGFSLRQAVILASIIYQEANTSDDRRRVAQVFEKRLDLGMPLGSDVTFIYAAKQLGVAPTPDLDSPYNTRLHSGLPPGPIGNFTIDALKAVAEPAPTSYLYFIAGDDGRIHYANTLDEHNSNVAKYCKKLCQ